MRNFIIYDLEATCWEHQLPGFVSEIIEIGAFRLNAFGEIRGRFNRFVRPVVHPTLSPFCKNLTTITQEDVRRAKTFPDVLEEFKSWARIEDEPYVLCSWGSFDRKMLAADCRLHRLESEWVEHHANLKAQYRHLKGIRFPIGLKKAIEREGMDFTGIHHRGISDAENLVKLFLRYIDRWDL